MAIFVMVSHACMTIILKNTCSLILLICLFLWKVRHQRAANRELAERLETLEEKLIGIEGGEILVHPSQVSYSFPDKRHCLNTILI